MKKLILSAILFLGITATGFSQQGPQRVQKSPEERAQKMTDVLDQKLSLTDDQKIQVYQIALERAQSMSKFKGAKKGADNSEMKAQFEASESKILSILNDNQKAAYNQLKTERHSKRKNHHGSHKKDVKK